MARVIMVGNATIDNFSKSPFAPNDAAKPPTHPIIITSIEIIPNRLNSTLFQKELLFVLLVSLCETKVWVLMVSKVTRW